MKWRFLSVCMVVVWLTSTASASIIAKGRGGLALQRTSPTTATATVVTNAPTAGSEFGRLLGGTAGAGGSAVSPAGLEFQRLLGMPFKGGAMAEVKTLVTPKNLARGLLGGAGAYAASAALNPLIEAACIRGMGGSMQMSESGSFEECVPGSGEPSTPSVGVEWVYGPDPGPWLPPDAACVDAGAKIKFAAHLGWAIKDARADPWSLAVPSRSPYCLGTVYKVSDSAVIDGNYQWGDMAKRDSACPAGQYVTSSGCQATPPAQDVEWRDVSRTDAENKLEDAIKDVANISKTIAAIRDYLDKGGSLDFEPPTVTGPPSSQGEPTTTTTTSDSGSGPQTTTTTTTTTNNYTYNNSTVNVTTTTTSTTRNQDGEVVSSTTTQGEPGEDDSPPTDTPLPPVPDLYVRKYPDGMVGIWNQYKEQIKASSLATAVSDLLPANIGDGGTCPSWPLNLSMASWADFGTHDVAPPCWIWGVAKAILILSALLLARALIFGG